MARENQSQDQNYTGTFPESYSGRESPVVGYKICIPHFTWRSARQYPAIPDLCQKDISFSWIRLDFYQKRYGSDTLFFGWELWNEMNAMHGPQDSIFFDWNEKMLKEDEGAVS